MRTDNTDTDLTDLTDKVMRRVVAAEEKRSWWWLGRFLTVIGAVALVVVVFAGVAMWQMQQQGTWDLVELAREDPEIVRNYWADTAVTFWQELPSTDLVVAVAAIVVGVGVVVWARKKVRISLKRLQQSGKREK